MSYLARLKRLEEVSFSQHPLDTVLPKSPKAPFDSFGSTDTGVYAKKISSNTDRQPHECKVAGALAKLETLKNRQREVSRQKAIAMLEESPDAPRAIYVDDEIDPDNIVLFVASRTYHQTCEMLISKAKYDPIKLLELIEHLQAC